MDLNDLERRVSAIEERNLRVESDKAWETSIVRILSIGGLTYIVAVLVFWMLGSPQFFLSALVPTAGFVLSVQSLPVIRTWWISRKR